MRLSFTKEDYKRIRGLTVANEMKVWGTDGYILYITGKKRMAKTIKSNLMKRFKLKKPIIKDENECTDMWFYLSDDKMRKVVSFIDTFNKKRISKVAFSVS